MAAAKYVKGAGVEDDSSDTVRMRADASRRCVRNLHQYPILSAEWLALVDQLEQLSRMTQLELMMPQNAKVMETQGRDNDSVGTLWDQEQHENAIRILVEEAKVNLCVRMMNDYKRWHYQSLTEDKERVLDRKCNQFEESLGLLLWRSFLHLETLQLTDVRLLLEHCALVLQSCQSLALQPGSNPKTQETLAVYYFGSVMKHAESLNNTELLAKMQELKLLKLLTQHMLTHGEGYSLEVVNAAANGLTALVENEDFRTEWEPYFEDAESKTLFIQMEAKVVEVAIADDPSRRRLLRPLLDFFKVVGRTCR